MNYSSFTTIVFVKDSCYNKITFFIKSQFKENTMLMIKTYLHTSTIPEAGLGLFADQDIKKGTITWKFCDGFDQKLNKDIKIQLSPCAQDQFDTYTYKRVRSSEEYHVLCGDNDRFINHSETPNIREGGTLVNGENVSVAVRDINKGEELLCDYYEFDANADFKLGIKNKKDSDGSKFNIFGIFSNMLNVFSKER